MCCMLIIKYFTAAALYGRYVAFIFIILYLYTHINKCVYTYVLEASCSVSFF